MNFTTKLITVLKEQNASRALLSFHFSGYLKEIGWFKAFKSKQPINQDNKPIPWVTYPFIHFIENRLNKNFNLFEYGSGFSTLFYAERVGKVISVEHDKSWYKEVKEKVPANAKVLFQELQYDGDYCRVSQQANLKFEIIIVDGRDRVNCVRQSLMALQDNGVIILDNSEREEYKQAFEILKEKNFRYIDFWGFSPGLFNTSCTTIFYRSNNCLNI